MTTVTSTRARPAILVGLAVLLALPLACGVKPPERAGAVAHTNVPDATVPAPLSDASIYDLDLTLVDAAGRTLKLADLGGRTLVASMVYTSCTSVCPRVTEDMQAVERLLPAEVREQASFVLFSLDPGRDTPAALRRFALDHALDASRWRLFATSEDGVRELSAVFGVKYRPEADGEIAHSALIFVVDRMGVVRHRQVGITSDHAPLVRAVSAGVRGAP